MHKLPPNGFIDNLALRPIISKIGTANYQLVQYLAKLLSPLAQSNYTTNSTKGLMIKIKNEKIPECYEVVSFDVTSLFTLVPLEHSIDIIVKRIYEKHEITTVFRKHEMKKLLTICSKNVDFSFNNDIYIQIDGVAMGSPLGPVLANVFMVELESLLVPKLNDHVKNWRRFVDDTIVYVKRGSIEYVLSALNSFHENKMFTYEQENNNRFPILDVFFRKETYNDLYLQWDSFSPISWKRGTLKSLISRAYMICSNQGVLEKELKHLKSTFHKKNRYPLWMINQVMETVKETINTETISTNQLGTLEANNDKLPSLILPYAGPKGKNIKSMNNNIQRILPDIVKTRITYTGRKLGTKFQIKDLTKNQHEHHLIYYSKCLEPNCDKDYLGETGRRRIERAADQYGKDKQSHLLKHALISNHTVADLKDFKIINKNYHGNKYKRKISEALYIKQYQPLMNAQEHSV